MRFRKLRIAWSVVWGVVAVLVVVFWVRSYWRADAGLFESVSGTRSSVTSFNGRIAFTSFDAAIGGDGQFRLRLGMEAGRAGIEHGRTTSGFNWQYQRGLLVVAIPYWFLAISTAGASVVPILRLPKRFGLGTMLIATTLIAVVLGLIVLAVK